MRVIVLLFVVVVVFSSSCSVNKLITDANISYDRKEYFAASEKYRIAIPKVKDKLNKPTLFFRLAESYRKMGDYSKAAIWYKNAIRSGFKSGNVDLLFADALRGAGKPDEAKLIYETGLKKDQNNKWAVNGMESIRRIQEWKDIPELYMVENIKSVNSISNDQVVQILPGNGKSICIQSSCENIPDKKLNPVTGEKYSGFFTSNFDSVKQKWTIPELLKEPAYLNSPEQEEGLNFDQNQNLIVFSISVSQNLKSSVSQLCFLLKNNGIWTSPTPIPFSADGADYSGPMITEDGKTLWFTSDREGGKGEFDIWKSEIKEPGVFGEPQNAGNEINTAGNEICPFQKPNGYLYFSSDFHPGIGGYDVFKAQKSGEKYEIEQLPPPINSCGDDLSIQFYGIQEKGFFSSNRKGSRGMDIYSFLLPPTLFQCFGKIHDSESDSILPDTNIRIVGSDGSSQKLRSVNGKFQASLNPETDYAIVVFANGYLNAQAKVSTKGLRQAKEFELEIKPVPTNKPIKLDNINYELGKWDLLPQAKGSLDKLVDLLKLNPEAIIEISAYTDDTGDEQFNMDLSEKRAFAVVNYLKEKGISDKNLKSKGYGESLPLKVSQKLARQYEFLRIGDHLNTATIEMLGNENLKEITRSLNRRTEFKVLKIGLATNSK